MELEITIEQVIEAACALMKYGDMLWAPVVGDLLAPVFSFVWIVAMAGGLFLALSGGGETGGGICPWYGEDW